MLGCADVWMKCHMKSRQYDQVRRDARLVLQWLLLRKLCDHDNGNDLKQDKIERLEGEIADMQAYVENQDRQVHDVLEVR